MRNAFLVQLGLNVEMELAVACILRYLVLNYGYHRKIVGLDRNLLIFDFYDEKCSCEA